MSACAVGDLPIIIKQKAASAWSCRYIDTEYLSKEIKRLKTLDAFGKGAGFLRQGRTKTLYYSTFCTF